MSLHGWLSKIQNPVMKRNSILSHQLSRICHLCSKNHLIITASSTLSSHMQLRFFVLISLELPVCTARGELKESTRLRLLGSANCPVTFFLLS
jgi:hypothetical protein